LKKTIGLLIVRPSPRSRPSQIDKILAKLGDKWDKILAGQGE
jgi:hypothetical protein